MLIDIFLKIKDPLWKLVIIGDNAPPNDVMSQLKKKVEESTAADRVILAGNISEVDAYYLRSMIFAFTSSSEGFPNVIGEAMSAGLPVVAFDCVAGPSEMISDGRNGFLVPVFDQVQFKEKLTLLMQDERLRSEMSAAAAEDINRYSIQTIGGHYYQFIMDGMTLNQYAN
jgi:glycosyltransferase involved in cell wall biosynthesis